MKTMIEKIFSARILALMVAVCATSGAWAVDADYICVNFGYNSYSFVGAQSGEKGISPYAVVGTRWTDVDKNGFSGTAVKAYDTEGNESSDSITVSVSGGTGSPHYWNTHDYGLFSGYIDDSASALTPSASFSGVPFDYYRVIVYFSSDGSRSVGHITVNDVLNLKGSDNSTVIGTVDNSGWGAVPSETFAEGANVLVSPVLAKTSGSTVKVLGHASRNGSDWNYRSCIAAIQIFKVADTPSTCTYTAPGTDTYNLFGAGNWDVEPASGSEAVSIVISGDTTLTVNDSRVFRSLSITGTGTLTLAGSGEIITPSVSIGENVNLTTSGQILPSAAVSVYSGSTFEIASACTWSGVISGAGSVAVSGREVVFSAANTYTGNLTIKSGGTAKSANASAFGPDWRSALRYVVVEDGGVADINGYGMVLAYKIAGDGAGSGALISTGGNISDGSMQTKKIILTADASIGGTADWGLLANSYYATELTLDTYTLTKKGSANFWICNATISGTGSFVIEAGTAKTIYNQEKSTCNNGKIKVKDGGKLWIGTANLDAKSITCDVGGTVEVSSGRQLLIKNGGDMTVNGTATITGTLKLAEDTSASSTGTLTVGGTVTVTGTVDIPHRANIVRSGTGKVDIKSGGKVHYDYVFKNVNSKDYGWKSDYEGDVFTGAGTLEIRTNRTSTHDATSSFSGIVKLYTASASNTGYINVLDGLTFTQRPEFITEGYYNLGSTTTLEVRDLSGSGVFWSNYSPSNLKYIDTKQTKPTTFSGTFLNDGAASNTRDVGLTVRGSEDGVYALTLSGASTSRTALTIQDNGKVIFPSTGGSWSSGTVVVANGGYIEAQNTSALGTVDIQNGSTIVIPTVSDAAVPLTATTVTLPTSGTVNVDLSGVSASEGDTVTVISATTLNNADATIFRQTSGNWHFAVSGTTITATKLGTLTWSDGSWSDTTYFSSYRAATITVSDTQTVSLPASATFETLTFTGSGTVSLTATGSETASIDALEIGSGVTLTANAALDLTGCTITGDGTFDIPAGTTFAMNGVDCSAAITASASSTINFTDCAINGGILAPQNGNVVVNTYGTVTFGSSADNDFEYSTTLNIESGTTTYNSADQKLLWCNINVKSGATFVNEKGDGFNWGADTNYPIHAYISGTLTMNEKWTIGAGNYIHLYDGALINGTASNALHFNTGNGHVVAEEGDSIITAPFVKGGGTIAVEVKSGATLSTVDTPAIATKTGEGKLLKRVQNARWDGGVPPANYDGVERYSSTSGTTANGNTETFLNSALTGIFKVTTENDGYVILGYVPSGSFNNPLFSGRPTLWANGDIRIFHSTADKPLTVNNLSGSGYLKNGNIAGEDSNVNKYIDTLQTEDTIYSGVFPASEKAVGDPALTVRGDSELHSLTLTGASDTTGPLTVENNAKVVFSSTGKWSGGTVTIKNGGVLESQNDSDTIASTLNLNAGGTLKIANVSSVAQKVTAGTVNFPSSGTATIDVSDIPDLEEEGSVVIVEATTLDSVNIGNLRLVGKPYSLAYEDNQLKVVNDGGLMWNSTDAWNGKDPTKYSDVTITSPGAVSLGGTSLSFDSVTLSGSGTVSFSATGSETVSIKNLEIGAGVTLTANSVLDLTGCEITGDGTLDIPVGTTYAMNGVDCSAKVTVSGTLETSGTTTLSAANTSASGSLIYVVGGTTTLSSAWQSLQGNITVASGAICKFDQAWYGGVKNVRYDNLLSSATMTVDVAGTLDLNGQQQTFGSNMTINLRNGANITTTTDGYSYADFYADIVLENTTLNVYGDGTISAYIRMPNDTNSSIMVDGSATLTIASKGFATGYKTATAGGSITKTGAGTLDLTAITPNKPITINAGTVVAVTAPTTAVVNEAGVLKLTNTGSYKDDRTVNLSGITGTGTIRYNGSGWRCLPNSSGNVFADTLSVELEQESGVPIVANNTVIGSISGSKNLRSDLGSSGKTFTVKQAKDGVWSGSFHGGWDGLTKFVVQGGASSTGTLTLAGTTTADGDYTYDDQLEVASSGSVNLTGLWIGATTVDGTFGGTGNITGALTFNAGSTFKVWATDADGFEATGALTLPASGKVTVDVSSLTIGASEEKVLLTVDSGMDAAKFSQVGNTATHMLAASGQSLKLVPIAATLTIGSTTTPYATVNSAVEALSAMMESDAFVTLVNGTPSDLSYTAEQLAPYAIVYDETNRIYGRATAQIGDNQYLTLAAAFGAAAASGDTVTLLRNVTAVNIPLNDKSITLDENGKTFSGTLTGNGTIKMTARPNAYTYTGAANGGSLFASGWTGTFQVAWNPGNIRFVLDDFGNANSTVEIVGVNGAFGAFPFSAWSGGGAPTVAPKVTIASGTTWTVSDGNTTLSHITTFSELSGGGNLVVNGGTGSTDRNLYYTLTKVSGYTGTLSGSRCNYKIVDITTGAGVGDCLVKVGGNFAPYQLGATTVNGDTVKLCVDTLSEQKGIYIAVAQVRDDGYASLANAVTAAGEDGMITILENMDTATVGPGQKIVVAAGVTVGTVSWGEEYNTAISITGDGSTQYTASNKATTYYWTDADAADHNWSTVGNWAVGSSDGSVATRSPTSIDGVVFGDGASVAIAGASCAAMSVAGDVAISGSGDLNIYGDVTDGGSGALTLSGVCFNNWAEESSTGVAITVAPTVRFVDGAGIASNKRGAVTITGAVSIGGLFKLWDIATVSFSGGLSVDSGATLQLNQNLDLSGVTTVFNGNFSKTVDNNESTTLTLGAVTVSSSTTPTISAGTIVLSGAVTVPDGATFTIPASGVSIGNDASFELAGTAKLVDLSGNAEGKVVKSPSVNYDANIHKDGNTYSVVGCGYLDGTTYVITNTTYTIMVPTSATAINIYPTGSKITLSCTIPQYMGTRKFYAKFDVEGETQTQEISAAFLADESGIIIDGSNITIDFILDRTKTVSVKTGYDDKTGKDIMTPISVNPAIDNDDSAPMALDNDETSFAIKTIPGLWYSAWSSTNIDASGNLTGSVDKPASPIQAKSTSTSINNGLTGDSVVRYYKIAVGVSKDDVK